MSDSCGTDVKIEGTEDIDVGLEEDNVLVTISDPANLDIRVTLASVETLQVQVVDTETVEIALKDLFIVEVDNGSSSNGNNYFPGGW